MEFIASPAFMAISAIGAAGCAAAATLRREFSLPGATPLIAAALIGAAGLGAGLALGATTPVWAAAIGVALAAGAIAFVDARFYIVPDALVLALCALAAAAPLGGAWTAQSWMEMALGGALLAGIFLAVRLLYRATRGAEGLGLGDVKLAGAIGLLLGPQAGLVVVAAAAGSTALWMIARRKADATIPAIAPFGAPLAAFTAVAMAWRAVGGAA